MGSPVFVHQRRVRDVATHRQLRRTVRGRDRGDLHARRSPHRQGQRGRLTRYRNLDTDGILDLVARNQRPSGLPSGFKGGIALTDGTIHHQNIRRALGLPRTIPEHRLGAALTFSLGAPTLPTQGNAKGLLSHRHQAPVPRTICDSRHRDADATARQLDSPHVSELRIERDSPEHA